MESAKQKNAKKLAREKFENDKSMDAGRLPSSEKGSWVGPDGKPCPPGTGMYKPDPEKNKSLYEAVKRHGKEGVPFKDGHPDFSGFPPIKDGKPIADASGKPYQVEIEMSSSRTRDFAASRSAYGEKYGEKFNMEYERVGTWHHEPDGVNMTLVDKKVHTAFDDKELGRPNGGTPHPGGDSMWRSGDF